MRRHSDESHRKAQSKDGSYRGRALGRVNVGVCSKPTRVPKMRRDDGVALSYNARLTFAARCNRNNGLGRWQVLCVATVFGMPAEDAAMKKQRDTITATWRSRTPNPLARDTDNYEAVLSFYEEVRQALAAAQPAESPAPITQHSSTAAR